MSVEAELTMWAVGTVLAMLGLAVLAVVGLMGLLTAVIAVWQRQEKRQLNEEMQHEQV